MKKYLLALSLLSTAAYAQSTYPSGVTGLIARYDFNGTLNSIPDVSGNNHPITFKDNVSPAIGFRNRVGNAAHFNGVSSAARANPSTQFNVSQVSIVALIKFNGFYSGSCQGNGVVNRSNNYYTPGTWGMDLTDHDYDGSCSTVSPNNQQVHFVGPVTKSTPVPAGNYMNTSDWFLLVTTYDGSVATTYQVKMDPASRLSSMTPIHSIPLNTPISVNNDSLYIGRLSHPQFPYWLNADVDEIAIFNKALNATEVLSVYTYLWNAGVGVATQQMLEATTVSMADNMLQINHQQPGKLVTASVFDMAGRKLAQRELRASGAIDLGDFASGIMLVRLECEGAVVTKKISRL